MDSADAGQLSAAQIAQIQYQLLQQQQYQCQHIESTAVAQNSTTSDGTAPAPSQRLSPEQIHYLQQAQLSQQHQQQQLESPMTHPVVSQITVQLQATQSRLHSIAPQLTSLRKELQSNSRGQHTQRMEAECRAVASGYEQQAIGPRVRHRRSEGAQKGEMRDTVEGQTGGLGGERIPDLCCHEM